VQSLCAQIPVYSCRRHISRDMLGEGFLVAVWEFSKRREKEISRIYEERGIIVLVDEEGNATVWKLRVDMAATLVKFTKKYLHKVHS
jgi:hypothetical protein